MKKQLLIAAVAATMGTAVIADVSITGNAKFEYFSNDLKGVKTNTANTEVNLGIKGKSGDTTVVANIEFNTHGDSGSANVVDIEDLYMTTKIGDVTVKGGNYASGTAGILGEIDEGGRASNKVTLSTSVAGVKIYAGNSSAAGNGATQIDGNMFAGISADVAGFTVQAKKTSATTEGYGIAGDVQGFGIRLETKTSDTANSDVVFGQITKEVNGINLAYAWIDADQAGLVTESDSSIFAVEMSTATAGTADANVDGVAQLSASTSVAGNTVTAKIGTVSGAAGYHDADYSQVSVKRALTSGATANVTYTNKDTRSLATSAAMTDSQVLEFDLSVKF